MPATSMMAAKSSRPHGYLAAVSLAAALVAAGCKTDSLTAAKFAPPPPKEHGLTPFGPARYVEQSSRWIERADGGVDHAIINGQRAELKGPKVLRTAASNVDLDNGAALPSWVKGGARYIFWKNRDVYASATFMGEMQKVATLPAESVSDTFDWLDGVAIVTDSGTFVLSPGKGADVKDVQVKAMPIPGGVTGLAADERRAIAVNMFGRALLTSDGGKSFRDVTDEVGAVRSYEVRGNDLVVAPEGGPERFIGPDGKIGEAAMSPGPTRGERPPDLEELWADLSSDDARYVLASSAIPLGDGTLLVAWGSKVAKIDAETTQIISSTSFEDLHPGRCTPVKLKDAIVLACVGERATIIDVTGVPRVERTFEVEQRNGQRSGLDGFSIADGVGVGYLGPCEGPPPVRDEVDGISGASQRNLSSQRSPVFCARASADHWIEHRLDAEDASDVMGWMPRPGGDAVALVARTGRYVPDEERITTRGGLRIVRIPRLEPPLSLSAYSSRSSQGTTRDMRAGPDGTIEAWLSSSNYGNSTVAAVIDPKGHVRVRPMPARIDGLSTEGPFAMAHSDDGKLYETVDFGKRWIEVKAPPGSPSSARPSECSPAGCSVAGYVRVGWDSVDPKIPAATSDFEASRVAARALRDQNEYRRGPPKLPIVKLGCSYASPGEGARQSDSYGFGYTPATAPRMGGGSSRLGSIGAISIPWWNGPMPSGLDVDLAWVEPFDLEGRIRRATIPLSSSGTLQQRPYEVRLSYVMDEDGRVEVLSTGPKELCLAPVLEDAGIASKIGGCIEDQSVGVRVKDRILLGSMGWGSFTISVVDVGRASNSTTGADTVERELHTVRGLVSLRSFTAGIGVRGGAPVGVGLDNGGEAVLVPIDPNDGYIGPAERVAPLSELKIGTDAKCPTQEKLGDGEARVLLPFDTAIGLAQEDLPGVSSSGSFGLAIVRWTKDVACLEAVEMSVRDERFDPDGSMYEGSGTLRKLIARFGKAPPKRGGQDDKKKKTTPKKTAPAASASASASASAAASASPTAAPSSPPTPSASASASASAAPSVAPIPVSPPLPRGAGEGTLLFIQSGAEVRQKLFCTKTVTP